MTYAIVETSGKQLWVEAGHFYDIDHLPDTEENSSLALSQVLLINHEGQVTLGRPYIPEAVVRARVLQHRRGNKIIVYKMRPKKGTRRKRGHRQLLTRVLIESIELNGTPLATAPATSQPAPEPGIPAAEN
jgi:large subunit ribosomal protein L21